MLPREIRLLPPRIEGRRVHYAWEPNAIFLKDTFWVEFPDEESVRASSEKLAEAYLPLCLAFAAFGNMTLRLPARLDPMVLENWRFLIRRVASGYYKNKGKTVLENGPEGPSGGPFPAPSRTALFFGGGTESLLCLSRLLSRGIRPVLISIGGEKWLGSDPTVNPQKFELDSKLAEDLGLEMIRIRTNFRPVVNDEAWVSFLRHHALIMPAILFVPFFISFVLPVCEQKGIACLVQGNEKILRSEDYFCFSPAMTDYLSGAVKGLQYQAQLNGMLKEEVVSELYTLYPEMAERQFSCWKSRGERWCHQCDSCLQYYALMKINRFDPQRVGLDLQRLRANEKRLIHAAGRSDDGFPGEIWDRLAGDRRLLNDPDLGRWLPKIRVQGYLFHRLYRFLPQNLREKLAVAQRAGLK